MAQKIATIALLVNGYDEAKTWYVEKLGFQVIEDTYLPEQDKRWLLVAPPGGSSVQLLLVEAANQQQSAIIGNQAGGRVWLFLQTDDFDRDFQRYKANGVEFTEQPRREAYGTVVVFKDLYGNLWDLIEPAEGLMP